MLLFVFCSVYSCIFGTPRFGYAFDRKVGFGFWVVSWWTSSHVKNSWTFVLILQFSACRFREMPFNHLVYISQILGNQEKWFARVCISPQRVMHWREGYAGHLCFGLLAAPLAMLASLFLGEGRVFSSFYVNCIKMSLISLLTLCKIGNDVFPFFCSSWSENLRHL